MIRGNAQDYRNVVAAFKLRGKMIHRLTEKVARMKRQVAALRDANKRLREQQVRR